MMVVSACAKLDPFTRLYGTIADILRDHRPLMDLVKVGNFISFDRDDEDPMKGAVLDGDFPALEIRTGGGELGGNSSSTSIGCVRTFSIGIATPDKRATAYMLPIEWEIFRALFIGDDTLSNLPDVKAWAVRSLPVSESDEDDGWTALIELTVQMWIDKAELKSEE